ncbi:MAG: hypothetical protein ACI81T_004159 [Bacteroidia bacterium]|jgi:hypothetical protein
MKKVIFPILMLSLVFSSCGDANADEAPEKKEKEVKVANVAVDEVEEVSYAVEGYDYYGVKELTPDDAVAVAEMKSIIDSVGVFEGKVQAKLTGVCKKAGCWVTIQDGEDDIRVMFGEHDFFVPVDTDESLEIVLAGYAQVDTVSIDMQKHFLDDEVEAGESISQDQYDAVTEDLIKVSFVASGILLKK